LEGYRSINNIYMIKYNKKSLEVLLSRLFNLNLALPAFPGRLQPSIIGVADLTSVFGMGTGVSLQLSAPENFIICFAAALTYL
jgi:hypothetical protein